MEAPFDRLLVEDLFQYPNISPFFYIGIVSNDDNNDNNNLSNNNNNSIDNNVNY